MAQIVKSKTGHWVGKEIYPGEQYTSHSEHRYRHPAIKKAKYWYIEYNNEKKKRDEQYIFTIPSKPNATAAKNRRRKGMGNVLG